MKWVEITVTAPPQAVEAIANILLECRTGGVAEEHPRPGAVILRAYLPVGPATDVTLSAIGHRIRSLPQFGLGSGPAIVETRSVDDGEWAHAWKTHFTAFRVGRRLWITPTWDETAPPPDAVVIALDPGMAFGSGLHPSTQLCLAIVEERLRRGETVFDVGTGSGILSIAAAKLGAASGLAVDIDPVAVDVAIHNVVHNRVDDRVVVRQGNLLDGVDGRADLLLANLTADLLLDFIPQTPLHLTDGGTVVASGILSDRLLEVQAVAAASGLKLLDTRHDAEWRCLILAQISNP